MAFSLVPLNAKYDYFLKGIDAMQFVSDVLKSVSVQGMTGVLCFKIAGAPYLLKVYFRDGLTYAVSCGRQKNAQALDVLTQGSIEGYHFVPALTTQEQGGLPLAELISMTTHLRTTSGSPEDTGTALAGNRKTESIQGSGQTVRPDAPEPPRHKAPTLPEDIPWE